MSITLLARMSSPFSWRFRMTVSHRSCFASAYSLLRLATSPSKSCVAVGVLFKAWRACRRGECKRNMVSFPRWQIEFLDDAFTSSLCIYLCFCSLLFEGPLRHVLLKLESLTLLLGGRGMLCDRGHLQCRHRGLRGETQASRTQPSSQTAKSGDSQQARSMATRSWIQEPRLAPPFCTCTIEALASSKSTSRKREVERSKWASASK